MNEYLSYWLAAEGWRSLRGRQHGIRTYACAIPTDEAVALLTRYSPIVEIGAGLGLWAKLARDAGATVHAYDRAPADRFPWSLTARERPWSKVHRGRASAAGRHADATLFLCWPPADDPMACDALTAYRGDHLIYVGEGRGGVTGDAAFFDALAAEWRPIEWLPLPRWWSYADSLTVYRRR